MKERLKEQLDLARLQGTCVAFDLHMTKKGIARKGCFSPIVSVETLEKIVGAYDELIKALVKALGEIADKEKAKERS